MDPKEPKQPQAPEEVRRWTEAELVNRFPVSGPVVDHIRALYAERDQRKANEARLKGDVEALERLARAHQEYLDAVDDAPHGSSRREQAWNEKEEAEAAVKARGLMKEDV